MNRKTLIKILLTLFFLIFIFYNVDFSLVISGLKNINIWIFLASLLVFIIYNILIIFRFKSSFSLFTREQISYFSLVKVHSVGIFYNFFLPTAVGGDLSKVFYLPSTISKKRKLLIVAFDRLVGFITLLALTGFSLIYNPTLIFEIEKRKTIVFSILLILILIIFFLLRKKIKFIFEKFKKLKKSKLLFVLMISVLLQFLIILIHYLLAISLNFPLTFFNHFAIVGLTNFLILLPITISGYGLREVSYVSLYGLFGISPELVMVKIILTYLMNFLLALVGWYFVFTNKKDMEKQ